jgi:methylmalonyl-CoA decarboxylase
MRADVTAEIRDSVAWLTLSSPPVNAITSALIEKLMAALDAAQPPEIRAVVLRAARGARVFSAGHDVRELPRHGRDPLTYDDPLRMAVRRLETHPTPVIAMVEGSVWGGACELVLSCDLVVAGEESTFALTPARLGVPYNMSGTLNLLKVTEMHFVKEMLFTAQPIPASRMAAYGVLNRVVPAEELERTTADLAADIASGSPLVHQVMKEELRVLANAHPMTPETHERIQAERRRVYDSEDYQEGLRAFMEKRAPVFRGR